MIATYCKYTRANQINLILEDAIVQCLYVWVYMCSHVCVCLCMLHRPKVIFG